MNEQKLNEIVEQTIAQNESDWPHFRGALTGSGSLYLHVFAEKFAELIVRECAEVADNADATREKWEGIGKYVREHFGVEE